MCIFSPFPKQQYWKIITLTLAQQQIEAVTPHITSNQHMCPADIDVSGGGSDYSASPAVYPVSYSGASLSQVYALLYIVDLEGHAWLYIVHSACNEGTSSILGRMPATS